MKSSINWPQNWKKGFLAMRSTIILYDFLATVKAAPNECVIRTGQP